jgi:hypothetical protein
MRARNYRLMSSQLSNIRCTTILVPKSDAWAVTKVLPPPIALPWSATLKPWEIARIKTCAYVSLCPRRLPMSLAPLPSLFWNQRVRENKQAVVTRSEINNLIPRCVIDGPSRIRRLFTFPNTLRATWWPLADCLSVTTDTQ